MSSAKYPETFIIFQNYQGFHSGSRSDTITYKF